MTQLMNDVFFTVLYLFSVFNGFYYLYGLAIILAFVAAMTRSNGSAYKWMVAALVCFAFGAVTHFAATNLLSGFYARG